MRPITWRQIPPKNVFMQFSCKFWNFSSSLWLSASQTKTKGLNASREPIMARYWLNTKVKKCLTAPVSAHIHTHTHKYHEASHTFSLAHTKKSIQSSWRVSQLICRGSFGSNYCHQRRLLLSCVSKKKRSPGSGTYHNIIHFLANGRAVNEGLVSHHAPLIALITLIQKILEELFLNAVTGTWPRGELHCSRCKFLPLVAIKGFEPCLC